MSIVATSALEQLDVSHDVEVWCVDLNRTPPDEEIEELAEVERARAARFVFERDRRWYLTAHTRLRQVLSARTGHPPGKLEFIDGPFGKPRLRSSHYSFNLSHSEDRALVAVAEGVEIGVDLEATRKVADAMLLAETLYTAHERADLATMTALVRDRAFMYCWTRKEACLKAIGCGLSVSPHTFEVGTSPETHRVQVTVPGGRADIVVQSFRVGERFIGALARVLSIRGHLANQVVSRGSEE